MERIINLLYEIEEKANKIVNRASDEKIQLYESLQNEMKEFDARIALEYECKLQTMQEQANKELEKEQQALEEEYKKQLASLEDYYKLHHDEIVDELFCNIIDD